METELRTYRAMIAIPPPAGSEVSLSLTYLPTCLIAIAPSRIVPVLDLAQVDHETMRPP
jgi:hypothetical protein